MNSRRSLDNGRIGILGHDQLKQYLELFVAGQGAVILTIGIVCFIKGTEFSDDSFHEVAPEEAAITRLE
jgi:hypothetical protein